MSFGFATSSFGFKFCGSSDSASGIGCRLERGKDRSGQLDRICLSMNFRVSFHGSCKRDPAIVSSYQSWVLQTLLTTMENPDRQIFKLSAFCRFSNKIDLWKTKHRQTKCCTLSRSTDRNDPDEGRVCPSIDSVCCGNIWTETHKLLDPDKLSVITSLRFSRVNLQTQSSKIGAQVFSSTKRFIGSIGVEKCSPIFVETNSNSIDRQTRPSRRSQDQICSGKKSRFSELFPRNFFLGILLSEFCFTVFIP